MKQKLRIVFILIGIALFGVIIFQVYWTVNAYEVNKQKFDINVNTAMEKAMDDCKKDYFDSIRRVLIKRLSPPETTIKVDTLHEADTVNVMLFVWMSNKYTSFPEPYNVTTPVLRFYQDKIGHKASLPEILTEMSFYVPNLMGRFTMLLGMNDIAGHPSFMKALHHEDLNSTHELVIKPGTSFNVTNSHQPNKLIDTGKKAEAYKRSEQLKTMIKKRKDSLYQAYLKRNNIVPPKYPDPTPADYRRADSSISNSIYAFPPNFRKADSIRLSRYLKKELVKMQIGAAFNLVFSLNNGFPSKLNMHYSETAEYSYKYHGFKVFGIVGPEFFVRAAFNAPQYSVLKGMLVTIFLSLFLVLFIIFCFNYIIRTFIEQRKLAELKDDFINNMTHELKTPIAVITVAIEGLQKFNALNDAEKTQRYLQTSRNELARLNALVTKVLDIAAFENHEVGLKTEVINVDELINDVIASEKIKTEKQVTISYQNIVSIRTIYADKTHFRNILVNLVDNAIKYAIEPVDIMISCYQKNGFAFFSVKDNGIGIPADHVGLIFDKFHRVPTGNIHAVKGTGLGLSYVKYITEAHGGKIIVKSEINKGSEFIVSIPLSDG
jgi:signal transduction histidine kinase